MDKNNKYYNTIENLIKNHRKFPGYESIIDEIIDDVYSHSEIIISSIQDENVIKSYLEKIISTSLVTVPRKLNFHKDVKHKTIEIDYQRKDNLSDNTQSQSFDNIKAKTEYVDRMINSAENTITKESDDTAEINEENLELEESVSGEENKEPEMFFEVDNTEEKNENETEDLTEGDLELIQDMAMIEEFPQTKEFEDFTEEKEELIDDNLDNMEEEILTNNENNEEEFISVINSEQDDDILDSADFQVIESDNFEQEQEFDFSNNDSNDEENAIEELDEVEEIDFNNEEKILESQSDENLLLPEENEEDKNQEDSDTSIDIREDIPYEGTDYSYNVNDYLSEDSETDNLDIQESLNNYDITVDTINDADELPVSDLNETSLDNSLNDNVNEPEELLSADNTDEMFIESVQDDVLEQNIDCMEPIEEFNPIEENDDLLIDDNVNSDTDDILTEFAETKENSFTPSDFSCLHFEPDNNTNKNDCSNVASKIYSLNDENPDLNILKVYNLKYKDNLSVAKIAEELSMSEKDVVDALDKIISLV